MRRLPRPHLRSLALLGLVAVIGGGLAIAVPLLASGSTNAKTGSFYDSGASLDLHPAAGNFKPDDTKLASCGENPRCYEQAFGNLAYYDGPTSTLKLYMQTMQTNSTVESDCHRIAHTIGSAALAHFHGNVSEAFALGTSACWSGYYHGILERSFAKASTPAKFREIARSVCASHSLQSNTWLLYQCVHGLGHGLMIQSGYNLPFSLKICHQLQTSWDQISCTGGVFMENFAAGVTSVYGVKSPYVKDSDLLYPCDAVAKRDKLYCYLMVTSRILEANGYDWKATAQTCARAEAGWKATCFQSFGRDADGNSRQKPQKVLQLCRIAGAWERECVIGAAKDMTANYANGKVASTFCNIVRPGQRAYCFWGVGQILGSLHTDLAGRTQACAELTRRYARVCARGANGLSL